MEEIDKLEGIDLVEKVRLKLECEKIRIERLKMWGTSLSILIPLLIAIGAAIFNIMLQEKRARIDFEIKAVEIVMTASSPTAAANKAAVLAELFPSRIPRGFWESFSKLYGSSEQSTAQ